MNNLKNKFRDKFPKRGKLIHGHPAIETIVECSCGAVMRANEINEHKDICIADLMTTEFDRKGQL